MNPFKLLLISRILRSFAMSFIFLVIPLYLKGIGYNLTEIGLIYIPFITSAITIPILLGWLGDKIGYKYSLVITDVLMVSSLLLLSSSNNLLIIVLAGLIGGYNITNGGLRGAFSPTQSALIANIYNRNERIKILSYIIMAAGFAGIFGPALLLFRYIQIDIYVSLLRTGAIIILISIVPLLFIKEKEHKTKTSKLISYNTFRFLWRIILINSVSGFATGIFMPLLPLWLLLRYDLSNNMVGISFILINIGASFGALLSDKLTKKLGMIKILTITRITAGLLLIIAALSPFIWLFLIIYIFRSFINGTGSPTRSIIVVNNVDTTDMGSASGISGSITRLSALSTGLSGYLIDTNIFLPFIIAGFLQIFSGTLYHTILKDKIRR